jgi:hypothetical protein
MGRPPTEFEPWQLATLRKSRCEAQLSVAKSAELANVSKSRAFRYLQKHPCEEGSSADVANSNFLAPNPAPQRTTGARVAPLPCHQ